MVIIKMWVIVEHGTLHGNEVMVVPTPQPFKKYRYKKQLVKLVATVATVVKLLAWI